jgi:hypothetical protein
MFVLLEVDLVSGYWKAIGVTSTEINAKHMASILSNDRYFVCYNEVPQLEDISEIRKR